MFNDSKKRPAGRVRCAVAAIAAFLAACVAFPAVAGASGETYVRSVSPLPQAQALSLPPAPFASPVRTASPASGAAVAADLVPADPGLANAKTVEAVAQEGVDALLARIEALEAIIDLNVDKATKVPVLLYHHLVRETELTDALRDGGMTISVEQFTEQMEYLYDNRYYVASVEELEQWKQGRIPLPKKTVVITFDDGYRSNTKYAYPVLKRLGYRASVFLITSLIGRKENVIEHASWNDMQKCRDVFAFYSHTHDLHRASRGAQSAVLTEPAADVFADILMSKALLDAPYIAYPYGQRDDTVEGLVAGAGYRMAFTTELEYVAKRGNAYNVPRFTISPAYTAEDFARLCNGDGARGSAPAEGLDSDAGSGAAPGAAEAGG